MFVDEAVREEEYQRRKQISPKTVLTTGAVLPWEAVHVWENIHANGKKMKFLISVSYYAAHQMFTYSKAVRS